jgi:hypothetical protein
VHFHILVLDGTYEHKSTGRAKFYPAKAPTEETTKALADDISKHINNHLVKKGYLEKQEDLTLLGNTEEIFSKTNDSLHLPAQAASVANQIAFGPNTGKPVRRLKLGNRPWPSEDDVEVSSTACAPNGSPLGGSMSEDILCTLQPPSNPVSETDLRNLCATWRDQRSLMNDLA